MSVGCKQQEQLANKRSPYNSVQELTTQLDHVSKPTKYLWEPLNIMKHCMALFFEHQAKGSCGLEQLEFDYRQTWMKGSNARGYVTKDCVSTVSLLAMRLLVSIVAKPN